MRSPALSATRASERYVRSRPSRTSRSVRGCPASWTSGASPIASPSSRVSADSSRSAVSEARWVGPSGSASMQAPACWSSAISGGARAVAFDQAADPLRLGLDVGAGGLGHARHTRQARRRGRRTQAGSGRARRWRSCSRGRCARRSHTSPRLRPAGRRPPRRHRARAWARARPARLRRRPRSARGPRRAARAPTRLCPGATPRATPRDRSRRSRRAIPRPARARPRRSARARGAGRPRRSFPGRPATALISS